MLRVALVNLFAELVIKGVQKKHQYMKLCFHNISVGKHQNFKMLVPTPHNTTLINYYYANMRLYF